ncbi:MAG: GntR family transcriptional regulator [Anaerolineales bacterium]|nr:GntR family transcriptional regulator [Anaerolineales bacterium]
MKRDNDVSRSLHEQLGMLITETVTGEKLLSEPKLAAVFGVSRASLREAMRTFETRGLLQRKQGVGTFVIHPTNVFESSLENLTSLETIAEQLGLVVTMGDLQVERRIVNSELSKTLELPVDGEILCVSRVILAENRPVAYLEDNLPIDVISEDEVRANFTGSVLDMLIRRDDIPLASSKCEISAIGATPEIARALAIQRHDPILVFSSLLFSTRGRIIDSSFSYFLPGYFHFHIVRRVGTQSRR